MRPTDFLLTGDLKDISRPEALKLLHRMEEEGYENIQPTEGMCYVDGKWQQLKQVEVKYKETLMGTIAYADGNDVASDPLYRLISLQEET